MTSVATAFPNLRAALLPVGRVPFVPPWPAATVSHVWGPPPHFQPPATDAASPRQSSSITRTQPSPTKPTRQTCSTSCLGSPVTASFVRWVHRVSDQFHSRVQGWTWEVLSRGVGGGVESPVPLIRAQWHSVGPPVA